MVSALDECSWNLRQNLRVSLGNLLHQWSMIEEHQHHALHNFYESDVG
jgi:hypothetical protein